MDKSEREETTEYASKTIRFCLKDNKHTVALLLASIYAGIRLRTLLTNLVSPPTKEKWKQTSENLDKFNLHNLTNFCKENELLRGKEKKEFTCTSTNAKSSSS